MSESNSTPANGRPKADRSEQVNFLQDMLHGGSIFASDIFKAGAELKYTPKTLRATAKNLGILITGSGPSSKWQLPGLYEQDGVVELFPTATVAELRRQAKVYHGERMKSYTAQELLSGYSKDHPANEFDESVLRIVIKTIIESEWPVNEREWERIENLPSADIQTLIHALKSKPRRPMTADEITAATAVLRHNIDDARKNLALSSQQKKAAQAAEENAEIELPLSEIDAQEPVASFKKRYADRGCPVEESNKNLAVYREQVPVKSRRLTAEEIESRRATLTAEITANEEKLAREIADEENRIAALPTRLVSGLTTEDWETKARLHKILDSRPYTR